MSEVIVSRKLVDLAQFIALTTFDIVPATLPFRVSLLPLDASVIKYSSEYIH